MFDDVLLFFLLSFSSFLLLPLLLLNIFFVSSLLYSISYLPLYCRLLTGRTDSAGPRNFRGSRSQTQLQGVSESGTCVCSEYA